VTAGLGILVDSLQKFLRKIYLLSKVIWCGPGIMSQQEVPMGFLGSSWGLPGVFLGSSWGLLDIGVVRRL
jgi:hypothetical protein